MSRSFRALGVAADLRTQKHVTGCVNKSSIVHLSSRDMFMGHMGLEVTQTDIWATYIFNFCCMCESSH